MAVSGEEKNIYLELFKAFKKIIYMKSILVKPKKPSNMSMIT